VGLTSRHRRAEESPRSIGTRARKGREEKEEKGKHERTRKGKGKRE
jgi:hypothetical protein